MSRETNTYGFRRVVPMWAVCRVMRPCKVATARASFAAMERSELIFELDLVRARLDTLAARRLVAPFSPHEKTEYEQHADREKELLTLLHAVPSTA